MLTQSCCCGAQLEVSYTDSWASVWESERQNTFLKAHEKCLIKDYKTETFKQRMAWRKGAST